MELPVNEFSINGRPHEAIMHPDGSSVMYGWGITPKACIAMGRSYVRVVKKVDGRWTGPMGLPLTPMAKAALAALGESYG